MNILQRNDTFRCGRLISNAPAYYSNSILVADDERCISTPLVTPDRETTYIYIPQLYTKDIPLTSDHRNVRYHLA